MGYGCLECVAAEYNVIKVKTNKNHFLFSKISMLYCNGQFKAYFGG